MSALNYAPLVRIVATEDPDALVEIQLIPAGSVDVRRAGGGDKVGAVVMDQDAFDLMKSRFDKLNRDVVIDFEHQVLGDAKRADGLAPAAGWIKDIRFDAEHGLMASVEWTAEAREMIRSGKYRYLSPVFFSRKSDRRVVELHSAAVTNNPAIPGMMPLAAKRTTAMPKKKVTKGTLFVLGDEVANRLVCQDEVDPAEIADEVVEQIDPLGEKLAELKAVLMGMGAIAEDAQPVDIVDAAIAQCQGGGGEEESEATDTVDAVRKSLGLGDDTDKTAIVAKLDELQGGRVSAETHEQVVKRLEELEKLERDRKGEALISAAIDAGKLNPNDEEQMSWAKRKASADPEDFSATMAAMKPQYDPSRKVTADGEDPSIGEGKRAMVIATARKEFKAAKAKGEITGEEWAWTETYLREEGLDSLTEDETKTLIA